jgi:NAD(P)-dependent dehydrogenase (short-subunit alcohol dehydrogenase family)
LTGKVVFITGAARGIGRATAAALVAEGARVSIGDLDGKLAAGTARELGPDVQARQLDVTDHAAFTAALDEVERTLGPLDVLINNAGVMAIGRAEDDTHESAYRQFAINVFAVMHGTREAIHRMKPRGHGHIVNVASMAGVVPIPGAATYAASKHAVVGFCESLYWELRGSGVDLSYVLPTLVNTDLAAGVKRTRAAHIIEPEEVAGEIVGALKVPPSRGVRPAVDGPDHEGHRAHPAPDRRQDHDRVRLRSSRPGLAGNGRPVGLRTAGRGLGAGRRRRARRPLAILVRLWAVR